MVEDEETITRVLPEVQPLVREGMNAMLDVQVLS
ncbi:MAG: hypothetical protein IT158_26405 [Bryobacterales bacterium]|nr:hypothetical protein [Bryobacterales bacterium]